MTDWSNVVAQQHCPYLGRKCLKVRKSAPDIAIGTCTVSYGKPSGPVVICPFRLLERRQIFTDCIHLLTLHEPGNALHIVTELSVPGGSIDYCLVSARKDRAVDFVGIEIQTMDTTGTVWPERQRFLRAHGIKVRSRDAASKKTFGVNWKMTAKTILVQLHHKIETFECLSRHLVLATQDRLIEYMRKRFVFDHLAHARAGDSMHFHSYRLVPQQSGLQLELAERMSTDANGIRACLGLQASANVELDDILMQLTAKLSARTLISLGEPPPPTGPLAAEAAEPI